MAQKSNGRSFSYGKTIHAQALTEKGRENWDRIFKKKDDNKDKK
jgi:hypothetical protein